MEKLLTPLVIHLISYIKDDEHCLHKLPKSINCEALIYTCDIVSLCTSIPHDSAIKYWINKKRTLIPPRFTNEFIMESVLLLLSSNNFLFNGDYYHQLTGLAITFYSMVITTIN